MRSVEVNLVDSGSDGSPEMLVVFLVLAFFELVCLWLASDWFSLRALSRCEEDDGDDDEDAEEEEEDDDGSIERETDEEGAKENSDDGIMTACVSCFEFLERFNVERLLLPGLSKGHMVVTCSSVR